MYFSRTILASFTTALLATAAASFYFLLQELRIGHHAVADEVPLNDCVKGEHHVISTCQSTNTTFSCKSEVSNCEFVTHKLPDGALLQFTLEPVHWLQCIYDSPVKITGHGGLTVMKVQTELVGSGAHREVHSTLTVHLREHKMCNMVVLQRLPPGVFVDLFQLEGLTARKVHSDAVVYGDHDLERPALHSSSSSVIFHSIITADLEESQPMQVEISLAVHARYPPLNLDTYSVVELSAPQILFQCPIGPEKASKESVLGRHKGNMPWSLLSWNESTKTLKWAVPAGNPSHTPFVALATPCTALIGTMIIIVVTYISFALQ